MKRLNKEKGKIGEKIAEKYLKTQKFTIIYTNFSNYIGEIDIIAKEKDVYVFVEVKSREDCLFGRPCEAVDKRKQEKIKKVATFYLMENKLFDVDVRFDVIEILGSEINHIKDAF